LLACLTYVSARVQQKLVQPLRRRVTTLVSYEPFVVRQKFVPAPVLTRPQPALESPLKVAPLVVTPQLRVVSERRQVEAEPAPPTLKLEGKLPVIQAAPTSQIVAVGTFSHESPVTAPVAKLATVQASGFGNISGAASANGNGLGTANPTLVANAGFGNGSIDASNGDGTRRRVGLQHPAIGASTPVEITFKPKPNYTDEGREQKINGEVRLEVLFRSDGQVRVIRVLQGLGYGLDEQAVKAAEQIKFKPALREGQPVDSMALVHIIFELIS